MEDKFGEKLAFDPEWRGPLRKRSCTDLPCLFIFLIFLFCWGGIGYYALSYGDIERLMVPTDSEGRKCGIDSDVENMPYLVFFDLTKCISVSTSCNTPQVCRENCPKENFIYSSQSLTIEEMKAKLICTMDVNLTLIETWNEIDNLVSNEKCARWYLNSNSITGRCLPLKPLEGFVNTTINENNLNLAKKAIAVLAEIERVLRNISDDLEKTKYHIPLFILGSAIVTIVYIFLLRWFTTPFVWVTICGICAALAAGTYISCQLYYSAADDVKNWWLALTIICGIFLGIVVLITICLRRRIYLACQLIEESSKAVVSVLSSLVFPIFPWILKILVLLFAIAVAFHLISFNEPSFKLKMNDDSCICPSELNYQNNSVCDPKIFNDKCRENNKTCISAQCQFQGNHIPKIAIYLLIYNAIGFIWLTFFITDLGKMVLSATFATWYWTFRKEDVPFFTVTVSIWRTFRYHLGTLAFGSLIITICNVIRAILEVINKKLRSYNNEVADFALSCCRWSFWLLDKFFKFINSNAYIMCAVHGKGFYSSAKESFHLLMRNIIRVFLLSKITDWILTVGKIFIIALSIFATWWYYTHMENSLNYWVVPVIIVAIGAYMLTTSFFHVQTAAIDTLFLCFLEDTERNDGSFEKPYFMSRSLKKVLHRH